MKITGLLLSMLLFSVSALASVPSYEKFNSVYEISDRLGYKGNDVVICLDGAGKMVLGGISAWHSPLQVFLVQKNGTVTKTKLVSSSDPMKSQYAYTTVPGNKRIDLVLTDMKGLPQSNSQSMVSYIQYKGFLTIAPQEMAQVLTCYMRNSGLE